MLNVIDEFTHECLAIRIDRKLKAVDVIDVLSDCSSCAACPDTSDRTMGQNSSPRQSKTGSRRWVPEPPTSRGAAHGKNGYVESFNARLPDELLDGEIFYKLKEAQIVIESWRRHYNAVRPHASLGYKPPAPKCSCLTLRRGRLRALKPLRRPRSPWRRGRC
jgi:putative transposase